MTPHEGKDQDDEVLLPPALAERMIAIGERQLRARGLVAPPSRRQAWRARSGWLVAAAAVVAWLYVPSPLARRRAAPVTAAVSPVRALLDSLLGDPATVRVPWGASQDPAGTGARGEVIWHPPTQRGVMRFTGLLPNDPQLSQYQLWIIDAARDARYPVDGGVFDIGSGGEVLIPITARLPVAKPSLFAVTLESPGGVVVSSRERLVLAAPVGS